MAETNSQVNVSSAVFRALSIQEILENMIQLIDEPSDLARCARVNSQWSKESIKLLWRGWRGLPDSNEWHKWSTPGLKSLAIIASTRERFRYYMGHAKVVNLSIRDGDESELEAIDASLWADLTYTHLFVHLEGSQGRLWWGDELPRLIQSNLRYLSVDGGDCTSDFLKMMKTKAPVLRWLNLSPGWSRRPQTEIRMSEGLSDLLSTMPSLEGLGLGSVWFINPTLVGEIKRHPHLKHLELAQGGGQPNDISEGLQSSPVAFPQLRSLELSSLINSTFSGLKDLLYQLPLLFRFKLLCLSDMDLDQDVFPPLSSCRALSELSISTEALTIDTNAITILLTSCTLIESLEIICLVKSNFDTETRIETGNGITTVQQPDIVGLVAENLPGIRNLCYDHPCRLNYEQLQELATSCQDLATLTLRATFHLQDMDKMSSTTIFPCLETLELQGNVEVWGAAPEDTEMLTENDTGAIIDMLDRRAPLLKSIRRQGPFDAGNSLMMQEINHHLGRDTVTEGNMNQAFLLQAQLLDQSW